MKNSYDPVGNRTRGLSACSPMSQPTAIEASGWVRHKAAHLCITSLKLGMICLFAIVDRLKLIQACQVSLYAEQALAWQHSSSPSYSTNPRAALKNSFRNTHSILTCCSRRASNFVLLHRIVRLAPATLTLFWRIVGRTHQCARCCPCRMLMISKKKCISFTQHLLFLLT
jgi:hypothetical protein